MADDMISLMAVRLGLAEEYALLSMSKTGSRVGVCSLICLAKAPKMAVGS